MTKLNRNFGRLNDGVIAYAPAYLLIDGVTYGAPRAEQYAACGWLPIDSTKPEKVGVYYVSTEYGDESVLPDGRKVIVRRYDERPIPAPEPPVIRYSKLKLITTAKRIGKWDALKAWISAAGIMDEWLVCQYLASNYDGFDEIKAAVVAAGVATAEEVEAILAASVDEEVSHA